MATALLSTHSELAQDYFQVRALDQHWTILERTIESQVVEQHEAVASSQYYLDLAMTRFQAGIDSYLNVITAQTTLLTNQVTEVDIQLRQMTSSMGLIMSLGGSWDATELPSVHDVSREPKREAPPPAGSGIQPVEK